MKFVFKHHDMQMSGLNLKKYELFWRTWTCLVAVARHNFMRVIFFNLAFEVVINMIAGEKHLTTWMYSYSEHELLLWKMRNGEVIDHIEQI